MKLGSDGADAELVQKIGSEVAAPQAKSSVQTMAEVPSEKTELRAMLKHQLEYYFSRDNLSKDGYLLSQMDSEHYVPISVIANFNQVRKLTSDMTLIVQVLRESLQVQVDEKGEKVRPAFQRSIVILRETPDGTTEEDIRELFSAQTCPKLVGCEYASSNCWYAMFDSEEDAQQAFRYVREGNRTIKGQTVMARLKVKPSSTPLVLRAPPRAVTMTPGENVHPHHRQPMVPSQQQPLIAASQPLVSSQQSLQPTIIMPHPPVAQQPPPQAQAQQQSQQLPLLLQSPQQSPINRQYLAVGAVGNVGSMQAPPQRYAVSPSQPGIGNVIFTPGPVYLPSVLSGWQPNWHQPDSPVVIDMHHSAYHQHLPSSAQLFMPSPGAASGSGHQNYRHQRPQSHGSRVNRGGGAQVTNQGPGRQSNNPPNSGVFDRHFRNTGSGFQSRGPVPGVVNGHGQPPSKREVQGASGMRRGMRTANNKGTRRSALEDQGVTTTSDSHLASGASGLAGAQPVADTAAAAAAAAAAASAAAVVLEPAVSSAGIVPPISAGASPAFDLDSCSSFPALPGVTPPKASAAAGEDRAVLSDSLSCLRINPSGRPAVPHDSSSSSSVGRGEVPKPSSLSPAQLPQGLSTSAAASSLETKTKETMPVIEFGFDMPSEDSTDIGSPDDRPGRERVPVHFGVPKHTYPVAPGESRTLEASLGSAQSVTSSVLDFGPAGMLQAHSSKMTYAEMAQKVPAKDSGSMPSEKAGFVVAAVSTGIDESVLQVPLISAVSSGSALSAIGPASSNVDLTTMVHSGPSSSGHVTGPNRRHDTASVPPSSDLRKDSESQGRSELRQKPPTLVVAATATATT